MSDGLSICITTRNNLEYLKLCLEGLHKYSSLENEILIHVDGSTDGTVEWLEKNAFEFTSSEWTGIYSGWNRAAEQATKSYIILFSDDMYPAPRWDTNLLAWLKETTIIVPRLVEPSPGSYPPPYDCGRSPETFNEERFVAYAEKIMEQRLKLHTFGAFSMSTERFRSIGGFDTRFDPVGVGSIDLITALKQKYPNTEFFEAEDVVLYHFQCAAFSKIPNRAELCDRSVRRFEEKWGFGVQEAYMRLEK